MENNEQKSSPLQDIVQEMDSDLSHLKTLDIETNAFAFGQKSVIEHYLPKLKQIGEGSESGKAYQWRVHDWMLACFGEEISSDVTERNHRFIEEALELVQATGATKSECHQLVDYVFNRDIGEVNQEIGGVMVTLAALCNALGLDMNKAGETELERIWTKVEKIRAKQAAKPKHSPLPQSTNEGSESVLNRLYEEVKHGDQEHQDWLKSKFDDFLKRLKQ